MNHKIMGTAIAGLGLITALAVSAGPAAADPGPNNPNAQYRTFTCDDGNAYNGGYVGPGGARFFLVDSTSVFAVKIFTEFFPNGSTKTFNLGINGVGHGPLITCSYTDPQGVFNIFSGFITPGS